MYNDEQEVYFMPTPPTSDKKTTRLSIRVSRREKETIERASNRLRLSTSAFVVREAVSSAERLLADTTRFELPPDQWKAFTERLDAEPRELPAIQRLLQEPSPFDG